MKLTAEQKIERAHVALMQHKDFCPFSGMFLIGKNEVVDKPITASTNGRDVTYGREFVDSLIDERMLAFLIVHEAMHKAYRHMTTWKHLAKENFKLTNAAADYVINLQIVDMDPHGRMVMMPRDANGKKIGLLDERFRGMDTKQVYDILKQEQEEESEDGGDKGKGGNKGDPTKGQDDQSSTSPDGSESDDNGTGNDFDEHDWEGADEMSEEEQETLSQEIDHGLREGAILAGKMKGNVPRGIDEILHPRVDWREALRDFVKVNTRGGDVTTWRRPNRRFLGSEIIMPSMLGQKAETIVIGTDTSGSIGGRILGRFLGEMSSICEEVSPDTVEVLYWDTQVASRETYHGSEVATMINSTKPRGGGGTCPDCVPKFVSKERIEPQCVVMLTDGEFYSHDKTVWERMGVPVLWCVVGNKRFTPIYGQSVLVEE